MLARSQRGLDGGFCRAVVAADQLDEDVDGWICREPVGGIEPGHAFQADPAILVAAAGGNAGDDNLTSDCLCEPRAVRLQ